MLIQPTFLKLPKAPTTLHINDDSYTPPHRVLLRPRQHLPNAMDCPIRPKFGEEHTESPCLSRLQTFKVEGGKAVSGTRATLRKHYPGCSNDYLHSGLAGKSLIFGVRSI